jgi:hypothetical protein
MVRTVAVWGMSEMMTLRVSLDEETYDALMVDASRHVRPLKSHLKVILRQALGLEFPYPDTRKPASAGDAPGHGASLNGETFEHDARR